MTRPSSILSHFHNSMLPSQFEFKSTLIRLDKKPEDKSRFSMYFTAIGMKVIVPLEYQKKSANTLYHVLQ